AMQNFTLTVDEGLSFTSANATTFTAGTAGDFQVTTMGFPKPTLTRGGVALPSAVTFVDNGDGTGTLSGTPAASNVEFLTQITNTMVGSNPLPSTSADGIWMAFASDRDLTGNNADHNQEIFLYNTTTGSVTQITTTTGIGANDEPSISADGTWMAFASSHD